MSTIRNMSDRVSSLIDNLGKIVADSIQVKASAMTLLGDSASMKVEQSLSQATNIAVDGLSKLKASIDQLVMEMDQHQPEDQFGMSDMGGMSGGMGMEPGMDDQMDPGMDMGNDAGMEPEMEDEMPEAPVGPPERPMKKG